MKMVNVKELLAESLIRVASRKDFSKITIQDIVDECNTSRRTFYNHFADKYDLMNWVYVWKTTDIIDCFRVSKNWLECVIDMYLIIEQDKEFYRNIAAFSGQNSFTDALFQYCSQYFMDHIRNVHGKEVLEEDLIYSIEHHSYGIAYMATRWIRDGFKVPAETIAKWQYSSMPERLKRYMN